jgi:hypothetical protein
MLAFLFLFRVSSSIESIWIVNSNYCMSRILLLEKGSIPLQSGSIYSYRPRSKEGSQYAYVKDSVESSKSVPWRANLLLYGSIIAQGNIIKECQVNCELPSNLLSHLI